MGDAFFSTQHTCWERRIATRNIQQFTLFISTMNSSLTRKRPRYSSGSTWKEDSSSQKSNFGLFSLFKRECHECSLLSKNDKDDGNHRKNKSSTFFTFRMEHRYGGPMAQHYGEERVLLFRSDQRGAIGKIIYSSSPSEEEEDELYGDKKTTQDSSIISNPVHTTRKDELERMAQAKVHVLSIKEQYRGYDLGSLLFSEAMSSLRSLYHQNDESLDEKGGCEDDVKSIVHTSVRCQLDAEEDIRRHNKLVAFYEQLGCHIKPNAKINFINNNDGETYRKIPMQIALRSCDAVHQQQHHHRTYSSDKSSPPLSKFLPVTLLEGPSKRVDVSKDIDNQRLNWILIEHEDGYLSFRTTSRLNLLATDDGQCQLSADKYDDDMCDYGNTHNRRRDSMFNLERITYSRHDGGGCCGGGEYKRDCDETGEDCNPQSNEELWMLRTSFDSYLAVDPTNHLLHCSSNPAVWRANGNDLTLEYTYDTPARRDYYRKMWILQTVEYNRRMRERYLGFAICRMKFKEALDIAKDIAADPFQMMIINQKKSSTTPSSLRGLLYRTAESARAMGHPDWFQLLALVYGLGRVLTMVDSSNQESDDSHFDWTITNRSRIVGCRAPDGTLFEEFRHLNRDERDSRFNTETGLYQVGCGLENTFLAWTGTEYIYNMLKHNQVGIPDEGMSIVRFFSLQDWHKRNKYSILSSSDDDDIQAFVADFDELVSKTEELHLKSIDLDDESCDYLWDTHYSHIVQKYGADGLLAW